jgi:hypothetical protein
MFGTPMAQQSDTQTQPRGEEMVSVPPSALGSVHYDALDFRLMAEMDYESPGAVHTQVFGDHSGNLQHMQ